METQGDQSQEQVPEPNEIPHHKKRAFLLAYEECGNIAGAARSVKIDRTTHYEWLDTDPDYAKAFDLAKETAGDLLEDEAVRRAKGEKGSDTLLIFLLKGIRPDKYADRSKNDNRNTNTGTLELKATGVDYDKLSLSELNALKSLLIKAGAGVDAASIPAADPAACRDGSGEEESR